MPDSGSSLAVEESAELEEWSSVSDSGEWRGSELEQSESQVRLEQRDTGGEVCVYTSWGVSGSRSPGN